jgi:hypothetical protein
MPRHFCGISGKNQPKRMKISRIMRENFTPPVFAAAWHPCPSVPIRG